MPALTGEVLIASGTTGTIGTGPISAPWVRVGGVTDVTVYEVRLELTYITVSNFADTRYEFRSTDEDPSVTADTNIYFGGTCALDSAVNVSHGPYTAHRSQGFYLWALACNSGGFEAFSWRMYGKSRILVSSCSAGYQLRTGNPGVVILNDAILVAASTLVGRTWLMSLLVSFIGQTIDTNILCAGPPPSVGSFLSQILINPGRGALEILYGTVWPYFCECAPVGPPPEQLPGPTWVKPPDWPDPPTYTPNPTNPCLDLTEVRRKLDELLRVTGNDLALDLAVQRYLEPFATIPGTVRGGLTGGGSFAIGTLVGVRVEWTGGLAAAEWEGTPPYYKDIGWLSASDGGAMLIEVRVTRTSMDWLPRHMPMATSIGYFAKPGITLRITELLAEP